MNDSCHIEKLEFAENKLMIVSYRPKLEDFWFREIILNDSNTMSYNAAWGRIIPFQKMIGMTGTTDGLFTTMKITNLLRESHIILIQLNVFTSQAFIYLKYRGKGYGKRGCPFFVRQQRKTVVSNFMMTLPLTTLLFKCF